MADQSRAPDHAVRVLIVDDHPIVRATVRELIAGLDGFHTIADAGTGEDALELARQEHPDLVVLDVRLPGIDGLEACRRIKAARPHTVVVLMSGDIAAVPRAAVADSGAAALIRKQNLRPALLRELWLTHRPPPPPATAM